MDKTIEFIVHDSSLYQFEVLLEMVKYKIGDCQKAKNPAEARSENSISSVTLLSLLSQ
ncbi:protein of unknown function [Xenorhabdus poinarii G6]|uniref:Uncharacterized protein n=1 Tax=Xenorhabdus poinarii G6 TaxID=1354304 RepID=A0A068R043_9GAMM|nr:protein of unknown function [Xenorhabdus poinarii G6]